MKRYLPTDDVIVQTARSYDIGDFLLCDVDVKHTSPRMNALYEYHLSYHLASRTNSLDHETVEVGDGPRTVVYGLDGHLCLTEDRVDLYLISEKHALTGERTAQSIKIIWRDSLFVHQLQDLFIQRVLFVVANFLSAHSKDSPGDPVKPSTLHSFLQSLDFLSIPTLPQRLHKTPHDVCQALAVIVKSLDPLECHIELDFSPSPRAPMVKLKISKSAPVLGSVGEKTQSVYDIWI